MSDLKNMVKRNIKVYFKDKSMFFTSLITPIILLVLYTTFLGKVYKDSFIQVLPEGMNLSNKLINGFVSGQLVSSLLAVCCITVAFTCNLLMVQDKVNGSIKDITIAPIKRFKISMSYFISTFISTIIVNLTALIIGLTFIATKGWYFNVTDVLLIFLDVFLITLFGSILSSVVDFFLKSQGQISAVGTLVSAGYGFICGAYMPISSFSAPLQKIISLFPGTYATGLIRNHLLGGIFREMSKLNLPNELINELKKGFDCTLKFFNHELTIPTMYLILVGSSTILLVIYLVLNSKKKNH